MGLGNFSSLALDGVRTLRVSEKDSSVHDSRFDFALVCAGMNPSAFKPDVDALVAKWECS